MRPLVVLALAAALAACATQTPRVPRVGTAVDTPIRSASRIPDTPEPGQPLAALPGWADDDHAAALAAYQRACGLIPAQRGLCAEARAFGAASAETARSFFEARFRAEEVTGGPGLLTGYFAPEFEARSAPQGDFTAPVRARPADLAPNPDRQPYAERAEIETRPALGALAWMRPEDLFFLQIQGSGYLRFADGRTRHAAFDGHNGRLFTPIARPMVERGLLSRDGASADAIRSWLAAHRGLEGDAIMRLNPRYVFFALESDGGGQPRGAAGLALPPGRAVAVDPAAHGYGEMLWLDGEAPTLTGAFPRYRRLVAALDTGGAIRGPVRADLYTGRGAAAGTEAGRIRHQLRMWRLVPR